MTYKEQIKHPKWQKKRLEILDRDRFQCQCCFNKDETLIVHHKKYIQNKKAWEYSSDLLITLCESCHESLHDGEKYDANGIFDLIKHSLSYTDYFLIMKKVSFIIQEQGLKRGYDTISKLLLSQTIKKDKI